MGSLKLSHLVGIGKIYLRAGSPFMTRQRKKVELIAKNDNRRDSRDDQVKKAGILPQA